MVHVGLISVLTESVAEPDIRLCLGARQVSGDEDEGSGADEYEQDDFIVLNEAEEEASAESEAESDAEKK
jgi:hypothetical protein